MLVNFIEELFLKTVLIAAALIAAATSAMAADVGVSIELGQPGFFGRIDVGNSPRPALVYAQAVIVQRAPNYAAEPVYLRVPPGHAKKWAKHCAEYNACGQKVYFVQDNWYNNVYAPDYRSRHENRHENHGNHGDHGDHGDRDGHGNGKGHHKE